MARLVYETLVRSSKSLSFMCMSPRIITTTHRHRSNQSGKQQPQLIEVDLDSSSSSSSDGEVLGIKKLEDVIHNIIVKRSAPDWLPFIPGSSYWVPPPRTRRRRHGGGGVVDILEKLSPPPVGLSDEESLSLSTLHGWPSSSFYFFQENSSARPVPVEMKVEATIEKDSDNEPQSEDEE